MAALVFKDERRRKVSELESMEWINYAVERTWKIVEGEVSKEVLRVVNPILAEKCPSFFGKLSLSEFTLGSLPPALKGISFNQLVDQNVISFDAELFFIHLEASRGPVAAFMTDAVNWNSRIVLTARLGLCVQGKGLDIPVMVKNVSFNARARIVMTLARSIKMPVSTVEFCFLSPPVIDFDLCPLKAIDLMNLPGLSTFIHTLIISNVNKMLGDPNSILIDLKKPAKEQIVAQGVVLLHIYSLDNKTDESCYAEIYIDGRLLFQTARREGTRIVYNEYFYLLVNKHDETVNVKFFSTKVNLGSKYGTAGICLKKFRSIGCALQDIKIWRKGIVTAVLGTYVKFYPIMHRPYVPEKHMTDQAVLILSIMQIDSLQGQKKTRNCTYNTVVQVLVVTEIKDLLKKEKSTVDLFSDRLVSIAGGITNNLTVDLAKNLKR